MLGCSVEPYLLLLKIKKINAGALSFSIYTLKCKTGLNSFPRILDITGIVVLVKNEIPCILFYICLSECY